MNKKILASLCALFILASASPIFAADATTSTTHKTVVLTDTQLVKLNATQTKLTDLVTKIDSLKAQYKNTTKAKGLLVALNSDKKQANKLIKQIAAFKTNPTGPVNTKIKVFQYKTYVLQLKVNKIEKNLKKIANKNKKHTHS